MAAPEAAGAEGWDTAEVGRRCDAGLGLSDQQYRHALDLQAEAAQGQLHPELAALTTGAAPPRVALQAPGGSLLLSDITDQHLHPLHGTGRLRVLVFAGVMLQRLTYKRNLHAGLHRTMVLLTSETKKPLLVVITSDKCEPNVLLLLDRMRMVPNPAPHVARHERPAAVGPEMDARRGARWASASNLSPSGGGAGGRSLA